jgi:bidirectional [NiFe] hydrogenase diaphorase subunit
MTLTIEDLQQIAKIEKSKQEGFQHRIHVCVAAGCLSCGSAVLKEALEKEITRRGLDNWCKVKGVGCLGLCAEGPLVSLAASGIMYQGVKVSDVSDILDALNGSPVGRLFCPSNTSFFQRQVRIVTENCGRIDPERIEDYIAENGYEGL